MNTRSSSFGENYKKTVVDHVGIWLSTRRIVKLMKSSQVKFMGDFGCGYNADLAKPNRHLVEKMVLVDVALSQELLDSPEFETYVGVLPDVLGGVPTHSLNLIVMNAVLEHLDDPVATLESIRTILSPGGILFINVPSWLGKRVLEFFAFRLSLSPAEEMEDHRRYYNKRELWLELRRSGFFPSKIKIRRHKLGFAVFAVVKV